MKSILIYILVLTNFIRLEGQNQGNLWFIGDSIGLDFNHNPPTAIQSPIVSSKVCIATLCDSIGQLLYYDQSISTQLDTGIAVFDRMNNKISTISGTKGNWMSFSWFLPFTNTDVVGYLAGYVNSYPQNHYGLQEFYYSQIKSTLRNGLGDWIGNTNSSISTFDSLKGGGGSGLTRHANGRDWWIVAKKYSDDTLLVWLAMPDTMLNVHRIKIGSDNCSGLPNPNSGANVGVIRFSKNGDKLLHVNGEGLIEVFTFDRCSGIISNPIIIEQSILDPNQLTSYRGMYSGEFSPSGKYLYACQYDLPNMHYYLVQYDLEALTTNFNKTILYDQDMPWATHARGFFSITCGNNNKMYLVPSCFGGGSCAPVDSTCLSTIEYPDVSGTACGLNLNIICYPKQLYSSYFSLAPNYDLGPIDGSLCDTLGIDVRNDTATHRAELPKTIRPQVYPNPAFHAVTLKIPEGVQILSYKLFDIHGRCLLSEEDEINSNINLIDISNLKSGAYLLEVETDSGLYREKVVVLIGY